MKKFIFSILAAAVIFGLSGCSEKLVEPSNSNTETNKIDEIGFTDNQLYAVAYLGYEKPESLSFYADKYSLGDNIPTHYFSQGEYYLIIPRYSDTDLQLYKNDLSTMDSSLIYEEKEASPFIIQCNISDIFSDATICLTYQDEKAEFSPHISLKDGAVEVGERGMNITE